MQSGTFFPVEVVLGILWRAWKASCLDNGGQIKCAFRTPDQSMLGMQISCLENSFFFSKSYKNIFENTFSHYFIFFACLKIGTERTFMSEQRIIEM